MNKKPLKSCHTTVSVAHSQEAIRKLLIKFGVSEVDFKDKISSGTQVLSFIYPIKNGVTLPILFKIEIAGIYNWLKEGKRSYKSKDYYIEQAKKIAWRHILDWVKANLNLVEFGLISFENIFLSYFARQLEDGSFQTFGEHAIDRLTEFNRLLPEAKEE